MRYKACDTCAVWAQLKSSPALCRHVRFTADMCTHIEYVTQSKPCQQRAIYWLGSTGASHIHEMHGLDLPGICTSMYMFASQLLWHIVSGCSCCIRIFLCCRLCCRVLIRTALHSLQCTQPARNYTDCWWRQLVKPSVHLLSKLWPCERLLPSA